MARGFKLQFNTGGWERLTERLGGMKTRLRDLRPALKSSGKRMERLADRVFATGKDPWGKKLAPLASSTVSRKGSSKPLIDTGRLRDNTSVKVQKTDLVLDFRSTRSKIGWFHQFGTKHMPARPIFPIDPKSRRGRFDRGPAQRWLDRTQDEVVDYILRGKRP